MSRLQLLTFSFFSLLGPRSAILDSLPQDASPTLSLFIQTLHSGPPKSFQVPGLLVCKCNNGLADLNNHSKEINWETNIPLPHIFRMAAHLIYWKKGKLIKSLSPNSFFIINPRMKEKKSDLYSNYLLSLDQSFSHSFLNFRLAEILHDFSTPLTLVTHVHKLAASKQKDFVPVVVWLLRHDLIIELNTYFYLNIPLEVEINVQGKPSYTEWENGRPSPAVGPKRSSHQRTDNGRHAVSDVVILDDDEDYRTTTDTQPSSIQNEEKTEVYPSVPQPLRLYEATWLDRLNDGSMIYKLFLRYFIIFFSSGFVW